VLHAVLAVTQCASRHALKGDPCVLKSDILPSYRTDTSGGMTVRPRLVSRTTSGPMLYLEKAPIPSWVRRFGLCGTVVRPLSRTAASASCPMAACRFQPGGFAGLFRQRANLFFERRVALDDVWVGTCLTDRLKEVSTPVEKLSTHNGPERTRTWWQGVFYMHGSRGTFLACWNLRSLGTATCVN
jgi:hypothetical protein